MVTVPKVNPQSGNIAGSAVNPVAGDRSAVGRSLSQAGNQLAQLAETVRRTQVQSDRLNANKREQEFLTQLQKNTAELDPLADDFDTEVETTINDTIAQFREQSEFTTSEVQASFANRLEALGQAQVRQSFAERESALNEQGLRQYDERRQQLFANIADDPESADVFLAEFAADARNTFAGVLTQGQLEELAAQTTEQAVVQEALGFAEAGAMSTARKVIDDNAGELDPSTARSAKRSIRGIESRKRAEFARATAGAVADLRIQVARAETPEEIAAAREQIESARERGLFQGRQGTRASLTVGLDQQQAKMEEAAAKRQGALLNYQSGAGSTNQAEADLAWEEVSQAAVEANGGEPIGRQQAVDLIADFAKQADFVPSAVKDSIRRAEHTDNEQRLATAAEQFQTIRNVAPHVEIGLSNNSKVREVAALVDNNVFDTHAEAATFLTNQTPRDQNVRKARREAFEDEAQVDKITNEEIAGRIDLNPLGTRVPGGRQIAQLPEGVRQEYIDTFRQNFMVMGDVETAQAATDSFFKEQYGVSQITGRDKGMRHPPERFVPRFDSLLERPEVRTRLIQDDLEQALAEADVRVDGEVVEGDDLPRVELQADPRTDAEVAAGERPTYRVLARQERAGGAALPVSVIREDGTIGPMRYTPPATKQEIVGSQAWRDAVKREGERIEEMRQRREQSEATPQGAQRVAPQDRRFPDERGQKLREKREAADQRQRERAEQELGETLEMLESLPERDAERFDR